MSRDADPLHEDALISDDVSTELSSNRTAMSFQRTVMSGDRTLMSVVRTSLSLISFGFTIYEAFRSLLKETAGGHTEAPRNMGLALISLGILLLLLGLLNHWQLTRSLRERRERLFELGIMHHTAKIQVSSATLVALLLLLVGIFAIVRIALHTGPI
jgi:putative membrane protein